MGKTKRKKPAASATTEPTNASLRRLMKDIGLPVPTAMPLDMDPETSRLGLLIAGKTRH
jgi:hypothetical protein